MHSRPIYSENVRRYLHILRRWAWVMILSSLLAGASAYYSSTRITPIYQASATLLISEAPATAAADYASLRASERLAQTYAELMTKDPVLEGVVAQLGLEMGVEDLEQAVQVRAYANTQLIVIRVEHPDPEMAAGIANTLAEVFIRQNQELQASRYAATKANLEAQLAQLDEQIAGASAGLAPLGDSPADRPERERLENLLAQYRQTYGGLLSRYEDVRIAEAQSTSDIVIVEPAKPRRSPVRPDTTLNVLVGAFLGLLLGSGIVFAYEFFNDTVRDVHDAREQLGLPVLGLIASHTSDGSGPVALSEPRAPVVEAFRALRTNLQFSGIDRELRVILVTSPSPGEGKSLVAANLAVVLAQSDKRVILIDADLRRPTQHKIFALPNRRGFSHMLVQLPAILKGEVSADRDVNAVGGSILGVVTSGRLPPNPAELLASDKVAGLLEHFKERADVIVVDSPPVLAVTDAAVLAPRADGVVLVVRPEETRLGAARDAIEQLHRVGARVMGLVFNDVDLRKSSYYYYKYKDYYYEGGRVENWKNGRLEGWNPSTWLRARVGRTARGYFDRAQYK